MREPTASRGVRLALLGLLLAAAAAAWWWRGAGGRLDPTPASQKLARWPERIPAAVRDSRPNLLFVVYDARRRDDFSFGPFGQGRGDTPFLAEFKDDAVYFEDAISPGCWTVPVHASIFSGLSICELGNDYFNPGVHAFPSRILSLAEILRLAGYQTIAYPDHPYFYNRNASVSLIRGFELFDVINDFDEYASYTNVNTPSGRVEHRRELTGMPAPEPEELQGSVRDFNAGRLSFDLGTEADYDEVNRLYLPKLYEMFRHSPYFRKRYGDEFDQHVFGPDRARPYFLFLNLHMCTLAVPDPGLYTRWFLKALMLNAQHRGLELPQRREGEDVRAWLQRAFQELGLRHDVLRTPLHFMKQVFDNRFYDACFAAVWEYLEGRGLTENTVTIVTSDHGLSFGEQGERAYLHAGARPHEYMTRVPLVIRFPGQSELSRLHGTYRQQVSLTDLFLTMVELGVGPGVFERSEPIRGRSLVERLLSKDFEPVLVAEASMVPGTYTFWPRVAGYSKAIYSGPMKLIFAPELRRVGEDLWPVSARLSGKWPFPGDPPFSEKLRQPLAALYDLSVDPHERRNLASRRPAEVARLRALFPGSWSCEARPWGGPSPDWDEEALETLRSLGYVH